MTPRVFTRSSKQISWPQNFDAHRWNSTLLRNFRRKIRIHLSNNCSNQWAIKMENPSPKWVHLIACPQTRLLIYSSVVLSNAICRKHTASTVKLWLHCGFVSIQKVISISKLAAISKLHSVNANACNQIANIDLGCSARHSPKLSRWLVNS